MRRLFNYRSRGPGTPGTRKYLIRLNALTDMEGEASSGMDSREAVCRSTFARLRAFGTTDRIDMQLAIFDLDNTLIGGDSDFLWGEYLCEHGLIDSEGHRDAHRRYYEDYHAGRLDLDDFLRFQLRPLADNTLEDLERWRRDYIETKIKPIILPKARQLIEDHRQRGHKLLIITATNRFITEPIATALGIDNLIATEPLFDGTRYTGEVEGVPSYREGKVQRMHEWLAARGETSCEQWFYSDSHNDIPLLKTVDHPVVVDPDETLRQTAEERGWPIISLR